jgi:X-X-X-Leu-X-X-Gly heptad repeat protein
MADNTNMNGLASRGLPSKIANLTTGPVRTSQYGEPVVRQIGNPRHTLADQGSYFIAHNITNDLATTLAGHPAPVLVDADATMTKPLIFCRNPSSPSSDIRCYLDYIEIEVVTAGAAGTAANWAAQLDTGATRYSSGTTETLTTVNTNMQSTVTPQLVTLAGPVVVGVESPAVRYLGFGQIRAAIEFVGDRTMFRFGGQPGPGANVVAGAATRHLVTLPPVILGSTDQFLLALYAPSQSSAGIYKVRMGWWEL